MTKTTDQHCPHEPTLGGVKCEEPSEDVDKIANLVSLANTFSQDADDINNQISSLEATKHNNEVKLLSTMLKEIESIKIDDFNPISISSSEDILPAVASVVRGDNFLRTTALLKLSEAIKPIYASWKPPTKGVDALLLNLECDYFLINRTTTGYRDENGCVPVSWNDFINNSLPSDLKPIFLTKTKKVLQLESIYMTLLRNDAIDKICVAYGKFIDDLIEILGGVRYKVKLARQAIAAWWETYSPLSKALSASIGPMHIEDNSLSSLKDSADQESYRIAVYGCDDWKLSFLLANTTLHRSTPYFSYLGSGRAFSGLDEDITVLV